MTLPLCPCLTLPFIFYCLFLCDSPLFPASCFWLTEQHVLSSSLSNQPGEQHLSAVHWKDHYWGYNTGVSVCVCVRVRSRQQIYADNQLPKGLNVLSECVCTAVWVRFFLNYVSCELNCIFSGSLSFNKGLHTERLHMTAASEGEKRRRK